MKKLKPEIIKKLSDRFGVSEKTIRNHISSLSKSYPQATSNARAQLYAQGKGISIFRMLDKEDKKTLPTQPKGEKTYNIKQYRARIQKQHWYEREWLWAIIAIAIAIFAFFK